MNRKLFSLIVIGQRNPRHLDPQVESAVIVVKHGTHIQREQLLSLSDHSGR